MLKHSYDQYKVNAAELSRFALLAAELASEKCVKSQHRVWPKAAAAILYSLLCQRPGESSSLIGRAPFRSGILVRVCTPRADAAGFEPRPRQRGERVF